MLSKISAEYFCAFCFQVIQHAVHLATVKTSGEDGAPDGPPTPSTSPAGEGVLTDKTFQQTEALRK